MKYIEFRYTISNFNSTADHLELVFEMINSYDRDLYFSRRGTPFDSYLSDCFIIKYNKDSNLKFDGLLVSRKEERENDILKIKSGETLKTNIKISSIYKFQNTGIYEIQFDIDNFSFLFETREVAVTNLVNYNKPINILNKSYYFKIDLKSFLFKTIGDEYRERNKDNIGKGIRFSSNTTDEQKEILIRITDELIAFYTAHEHNNEIQINNDYFFKRWFGDYNLYNRKVIDTLSLTFKKIKNKNILYNIDNSCTNDCDYAFTIPCATYITILPPFWKAVNDNGFYSQRGLILHEFTHIYGLTLHNSKSRCKSLDLAINESDNAVRSPYNYQFYIEDFLWQPQLPQNC